MEISKSEVVRVAEDLRNLTGARFTLHCRHYPLHDCVRYRLLAASGVTYQTSEMTPSEMYCFLSRAIWQYREGLWAQKGAQIMKRYWVTLFCVDENGEKRLMGSGRYYAESEADAEECAIQNWWDPRLEAASCSPEAEAQLIEDDDEE